MAKKDGSGVGCGTLVIGGVLAALMSIPKEGWIVIGGLAFFVAAVYFYSQLDKSKQAPPAPDPDPSGRQNISHSAETSSSYSNDDGPVSVTSALAQSSSFRVPSAPKGFGSATWAPPGQDVTVAGVVIPGGMLYVGTSLSTPSGYNDPCLIDPTKKVASAGDLRMGPPGYWPSYAEITPSARRAYLTWLSRGKNHPEADIGYVFLYFYGLERRAIIDVSKDGHSQLEWDAIASELRRLLSIYGETSSSFRGYASALLNWVEFAKFSPKLYEKPVPEQYRTWELPLHVKLALGQTAVDGVPVPAHLALAWARYDPNSYLRTPATRCPEEFKKLFELKYAQAFGPGLVLPKNKTKLKLVYRPASAGFRGYNEIKLTFGETPDVSVLTAPLAKLRQVVDAATEALAPYSRYLGRNPGEGASLDGLLQLPAPLWPESAQKALRALRDRMGQEMIAIPFQELLTALAAKAAPTKEKVLGIARALEAMNIAMEPDVLGGAKAPKPEDKVVLFLTPPGEPLVRKSSAYQAALLTLQLASAVATADGEVNAQTLSHLRTQIQAWAQLTPGQHQRLLAHLRLLMDTPVSLPSLKKQMEPLDASAREAIAAFMATVAQSDGNVSPAEVKMLEKVYKALGLDSLKVFSDVHAVAAGATLAQPAANAQSTGFKLDPARIAALQKDTERVSALLANIFKEEDLPKTPVPAPEMADETDVEESAAQASLLGLDEVHSTLARMLVSRPAWSRAELLDVASDLDLMLDGALEHINEASFEAFDIPFTEGDDPIEVSAEALEKINHVHAHPAQRP